MCNNPKFLVYIKNYNILRRFLPPLFVQELNRKCLRTSKKGFVDYFEFVPLETYLRFEKILSRYKKIPTVLFRVPCRKCLGCLSDRRRSWTLRACHEATFYDDVSFVTLTYDDEHLPPTLMRQHIQAFVKRLRSRIAYRSGEKIRIFYRGEYGDKYGRPHFHIIIFGYKPPDLEVLYYITKRGKKVYHAVPGAVPYSTSEELSEAWGHGFVIHAPAEKNSIKYVANYLDKGYSFVTSDGVVGVPPFNGYSTRPALGRRYVDSHVATPEQRDELFALGVPYYKRLLQEHMPDEYQEQVEYFRNLSLARPKPWEKTSLTEFEYLKQREERMREALRRFGRKANQLYDFSS